MDKNIPTPYVFADESYDESLWEYITEYGEQNSDCLTRVIRNKETGEYWQCEIYFGGSWDHAAPWYEGAVSRCEPREVTVTQYFDIEEPKGFDELHNRSFYSDYEDEDDYED